MLLPEDNNNNANHVGQYDSPTTPAYSYVFMYEIQVLRGRLKLEMEWAQS